MDRNLKAMRQRRDHAQASLHRIQEEADCQQERAANNFSRFSSLIDDRKRQVTRHKVRMKNQETIGNRGIKVCHKFGTMAYLQEWGPKCAI